MTRPDEDDRAAVAALFSRDVDAEQHTVPADAVPDEDRGYAREFARRLFSHPTTDEGATR